MTDSRRALVLVDIQNEYFDGPLEIQYPPREDSLAQILRAIETAREAGMPVAAVQHELPEGAPVFAAGSTGWELHRDIEAALPDDVARFSKAYASIFDGTGMADWLRENSIDTITLVGFMTNNCIIGSAVGAEPLGFTVEVLSDATGAISIANDAGFADAKTIHTTIMAVLHSNWASVASTEAWTQSLASQEPLPKGDLGSSAVTGAQKAGQN